MNQRFLKHYFAAKKPLVIDEGSELAAMVKEVEEVITQPESIWGDDEEYEAYRKLRKLTLEERRLMIVWSILDCSNAKAARLFKVDIKTISTRIEDIRRKMI